MTDYERKEPNMTVTERLRYLLDERGVEWTVPDEVYNQDSITYWQVGNIKWTAFSMENGTLLLNCNSVTNLTPEQVITTTLGDNNSNQLKTEKTDTKSQWHQLFGTPEKAARTLQKTGRALPLVMHVLSVMSAITFQKIANARWKITTLY